jgi:hypothetical protein
MPTLLQHIYSDSLRYCLQDGNLLVPLNTQAGAFADMLEDKTERLLGSARVLLLQL